MKTVFISGSISIKTLPQKVLESINSILNKNYHILVGDAPGVDSLVQNLCREKNYKNLTIYSIFEPPRYNGGKFATKKIFAPSEIKSERERQKVKDREMSKDADFFLVIWDGKSKGCYANISSAFEYDKFVKIYLEQKGDFIEDRKLNADNIRFIYRDNVGYTASEFVEELKREGIEKFENTRSLNSYLLKESILLKEDKVYIPSKNYSEYFYIKKHRGKQVGVSFREELINWFEEKFTNTPQQEELEL